MSNLQEDVLHQPPAEDKDVSRHDADDHSLDKLLDDRSEAKAGYACAQLHGAAAAAVMVMVVAVGGTRERGGGTGRSGPKEIGICGRWDCG